jgi:hypothetical protein
MRRFSIWFITSSYWWEARLLGRRRPLIRMRRWLLERYLTGG